MTTSVVDEAAPTLTASLIQPFSGRLISFDSLRAFVIVLVVLHHAVLAYCTFGHVSRLHYLLSTAPIVDTARWVGFDIVVQLNDSFFMPLLFLLSGLFVWSGLPRKGPWFYLRGRLRRLGLPFAVAALTIVPLAYYPSFLQAGGSAGFIAFWTMTVTRGPWPSGPMWFIAVLLLFDAAVVALFFLSRRWRPRVAQLTPPEPGRCFRLLLVGSILVYLPFLMIFGPLRWLSFGPVAIQGSRIGWYAAYFVTGIVLGSGGMRSAREFGDMLARRWLGWTVLAILTGLVLIVTTTFPFAAIRGLPIPLRTSSIGIVRAIDCAATCFALIAVFVRFGSRRGAVGESLVANSFAIYLLHYPVVTWMQYGLLPLSADAPLKAAIVFGCALPASWIGAMLLRRIPGVSRIV